MNPAEAADWLLQERLVAHWAQVADSMADLPIVNPRLSVHVTAVRRQGAASLVVVATPWFMNLMVFPDDGDTLPPAGAKLTLTLPVGEVEAVSARLDGFGAYASVSLISPMDDFAAMDEVVRLAEETLASLLTPPSPPPPVLDRNFDRRRLLFGRSAAERSA